MISNTVFLRGKILPLQHSDYQMIGKLELLEVQFQIETQIHAVVEIHPVLAYGMKAVQIVALTKAKLAPVEGVIEGSLSTRENGSITVARNITLFQSRRESRLLRH